MGDTRNKFEIEPPTPTVALAAGAFSWGKEGDSDPNGIAQGAAELLRRLGYKAEARDLNGSPRVSVRFSLRQRAFEVTEKVLRDDDPFSIAKTILFSVEKKRWQVVYNQDS